MTAIPHDQLHPETLLALIEDFITRDGAIHGHAETPLRIQVQAIERQLKAGTAMIMFDEADETWTIVPAISGGRSNPR